MIHIYQLCLFIMFLLFVPSYTAAQSGEELAKISAKIEREQERLSTSRKEETRIRRKLARIDSQLERLQKKREQSKQQAEESRARARKLEKGISKARQVIEANQERLTQRVVALYKMNKRASGIHLLSTAENVTQLIKRADFMRRVTSKDWERIQSLHRAIEHFSKERAELLSTRDELQGLERKLSSLKVELDSTRTERAAELRSAVLERKEIERALARLRSAAPELQKAVTRTLRREQSTREEPSVSLVGLARVKGKLNAPVEGEVIRAFGKQRHEEFADMLFVKGLEYSTAAGAPVQAVADGRVAFQDRLPGYGNVLILDHGKRYHTLYGRLAVVERKKGEHVKRGERIAVAGQADERGRSFYFEVRVRGKPVDPKRYLQRKS